MTNDNPSEKQLDFISVMEDFGCEKFAGTTKKEASEYISRNMDLYRLYSQTCRKFRQVQNQR